MDNPGRVRLGRIGDLQGILQGLVQLHPLVPDQFVERLPFDVLHRNEIDAIRLVDVIDRDDVGMVQGGGCAGFPDETLLALRVGDLLGRQHLEGDEAPSFSVIS